MVLGQSIRLSAPHLTDEQAEHIAKHVIVEQEKLQEFLERMIPGSPAQLAHPDWGVQIFGPDGGEGIFRGPKHPGGCDYPQAPLEHVQVLSLVTSPLARGVLRAFGFKYHFVEAKSRDTKLIIH